MEARGTMTVYNLAKGGTYSWPYTVDYAPDYQGGKFYLGSGDSRNGGGTFVSARDALEPQWRSDLEEAGALWIVPIWERMTEGEPIGRAQILEMFRLRHGHEALGEEWPVW